MKLALRTRRRFFNWVFKGIMEIDLDAPGYTYVGQNDSKNGWYFTKPKKDKQ